MNALTLTLKQKISQRLDMSPLVCNKLTGLKINEIAAIKLQSGKSKFRVDELFYLTGVDTQNIIITKSVSKLDFIGKQMDGGSITIHGNVGAYLGLQMQSGHITVNGNTGIFSACEMYDGTLEINGNTGDFVAASLPGNRQGMQGGTVLIKGSVGERAGDYMRRGTLLIEGDAGDYCGSRMVAGTIAVMGHSGDYLGYAMRRGTLLLWNQPKLSPRFNNRGIHTLQFLPILFKSFRQYNSKFADPKAMFNRVQIYGGDIAELGLGEVLVKL